MGSTKHTIWLDRWSHEWECTQEIPQADARRDRECLLLRELAVRLSLGDKQITESCVKAAQAAFGG